MFVMTSQHSQTRERGLKNKTQHDTRLLNQRSTLSRSIIQHYLTHKS